MMVLFSVKYIYLKKKHTPTNNFTT